MPSNIPYIYTGKNAATLDFSNVISNFAEREKYIYEKKAEKERYDQIQRDLSKKEFLKSIDVDEQEFISQGLKTRQLGIINDVTKEFENLTKGAKGDDGKTFYSMDAILKAQKLTRNAERQIDLLNLSEKNHITDLQTIANDPDKYSEECITKVKGWKGDDDYYQSKLQLRTLSLQEVYDDTNMDLKDPNRVIEDLDIDGDDVNSMTAKWRSKYTYFDPNTQKFTPNVVARANKLLKTMGATPSHQRAILHHFEELDNDVKREYKLQAEELGMGDIGAAGLMLNDIFGDDIFGGTTEIEKKNKSSKSLTQQEKLDYKARTYSFQGGGKIKNVYDSDSFRDLSIENDDGEVIDTFHNYVGFEKTANKGRLIIKNPIDKSGEGADYGESETWAKGARVGAFKGDDGEVMVVYSVDEKSKTPVMKGGKKVYQEKYGNNRTGTIDFFKKEYRENPENGNFDMIDYELLFKKRQKTIIAPLKDNPNELRGIAIDFKEADDSDGGVPTPQKI